LIVVRAELSGPSGSDALQLLWMPEPPARWDARSYRLRSGVGCGASPGYPGKRGRTLTSRRLAAG